MGSKAETFHARFLANFLGNLLEPVGTSWNSRGEVGEGGGEGELKRGYSSPCENISVFKDSSGIICTMSVERPGIVTENLL